MKISEGEGESEERKMDMELGEKWEQRWCGRALLFPSYKIHVDEVLMSKMHYQIIISKMYAYSESLFYPFFTHKEKTSFVQHHIQKSELSGSIFFRTDLISS